jgi:dGTPase
MAKVLDVEAVEAAALAHDIGHPPFGHLAEEELNDATQAFGGFEGNAQSFRVVTRLALRSAAYGGLNLTRQTLNGLLKYPWLRDLDRPDRESKWGAYPPDGATFAWARDGLPSDDYPRAIEAEIMDWADDVTYAVHDMEDFYRAGLIPLDRLCSNQAERERFLDSLFVDGARKRVRPRLGDAQPAELIRAANALFGNLLDLDEPYTGDPLQRRKLKLQSSTLIGQYISALKLADVNPRSAERLVAIDRRRRAQVAVLKELTWFYVINRPSLAVLQYGQRRIIAGLFEAYKDAVERNPLRLFPPFEQQRLRAAGTEPARLRVIVDYIAGMTEEKALELYRRMAGISSGSLLDAAAA